MEIFRIKNTKFWNCLNKFFFQIYNASNVVLIHPLWNLSKISKSLETNNLKQSKISDQPKKNFENSTIQNLDMLKNGDRDS